jgi:hypothetical protein
VTLKRFEQTMRRMIEERLGGRFRGRVHPLEVARALVTEMVRESQAWQTDHVAPNEFFIHLHPGEELSFVALGDDLKQELFDYLAAEAKSRDLRWMGAVTFTFEPHPSVASGAVEVYAHIASASGTAPPDWREATLLAPSLVGLSGFAQGKHYPIRLPRSIVGRDETCDVRLGDPRVSHRHATISWHDDCFWIEDLGSKAGTTCNGRHLTGPMALRDGDVLGLGFSTLRFESPV